MRPEPGPEGQPSESWRRQMERRLSETPWPAVLQNDDGIRPSGHPDRCFYCQQRIGETHGPKCVAVHKLVLVRYSFEIEIQVPAHWQASNIEFHRNESSWCANNAVRDVQAFMNRLGQEKGACLCGVFEAQVLGVADPQPRASEAKEHEHGD